MAKVFPALETIYFDLDGPIVDVSRRYFCVHRLVCRILGIENRLALRVYWQKKRAKESLFKLLRTRDKTLVAAYKKQWLRHIEQEEQFDNDRIFPFAEGILADLSRRYRLVLVSLRREKECLLRELRRFNIRRYFADVFAVYNPRQPYARSKADVIRKLTYGTRKAVFVGDTEVDIRAAKTLKIMSIVVLSGIRNRKNLERCKPDLIINDIRGLKRKLPV